MDKEIVQLIVIAILMIVTVMYAIIKYSLDKKKLDETNINENSYQRYEHFLGTTTNNDPDFMAKIKKIYTLITKNKKTNIKEIAELSNCSYEECVLKIKYLKNKRQIGDYYIDHINRLILPCSKEDQVLLNKYKLYIYNNHYQIEEIATHLPGSTLKNKKELEEQVYRELLYLYEKDLINGIKMNEVDRKIIYYALEKRKGELPKKDKISVRCPNCGALNDIERDSKVRCDYCQTIIERKEDDE